MKKVVTAIALLIIISAHAQTTQETITYNVEVENSPAAAMLGDMQMVLYYKNGKSLFDLRSSMTSIKTLITDTGSLMLMSAMGQKFYVRQPVAPVVNDTAAKPEITYVDETKEIAGYPCRKALVKLPGLDTSVFWVCDKLPVVGFGKDEAILKALKGMPLEYEMHTGQMALKLKAAKVSTDNVPESTFHLSTDGYTAVDEKALGGLMQ